MKLISLLKNALPRLCPAEKTQLSHPLTLGDNHCATHSSLLPVKGNDGRFDFVSLPCAFLPPERCGRTWCPATTRTSNSLSVGCSLISRIPGLGNPSHLQRLNKTFSTQLCWAFRLTWKYKNCPPPLKRVLEGTRDVVRAGEKRLRTLPRQQR